MHLQQFNQLKTPIVRDLYWLLFSPSPLHDKQDLSPYALFPIHILEQWEAETISYFKALDQSPTELLQFMQRKKYHKLGYYAEGLLSYFFQTVPTLELLLQNYQVIIGKKTVGEIDFIIAYRGEVYHLECAVKYYLLRDEKQPNNLKEWVGPEQRDQLALKLEKVLNHQLPLGSHPLVKAKINRPISHAYLFLKGQFFTDSQVDNLVASNVSTYINQTDLKQLEAQPFKELIKPNWLASLQYGAKDLKPHPVTLPPLQEPKLYLFTDGEIRFVVPKDWK